MKCSTKMPRGTLVILFLVVALAVVSAGATRVLPEDFGGGSHLQMRSSTRQSLLAFWLQRLSSGPSPSGPGH
ncbi:hypothetical protein CsatB_021376 [Cannabis sativa]